jgi:hypothetical protein
MLIDLWLMQEGLAQMSPEARGMFLGVVLGSLSVLVGMGVLLWFIDLKPR